MKKTTVAAATLIAAVPAVALGILLVLSFLTKLGSLPPAFMALYATTLLACAIVVCLPLGVLIFGPRSPRSQTQSEDKSGVQPVKKTESEEDESEKDADLSFEEPAVTRPISTGDLEVVEGAMTHDELDAVEVPFSDSELESVEDEDFFTDEEEPKKRPRK